jgi:hypothetical protein
MHAAGAAPRMAGHTFKHMGKGFPCLPCLKQTRDEIFCLLAAPTRLSLSLHGFSLFFFYGLSSHSMQEPLASCLVVIAFSRRIPAIFYV